MDIAKAKRRENIAEYILYLWQLEDLLRALQFSPEAIFSTLIAPRKDIGEEQKHVFLLWYMDLANLLRQEGKEETKGSPARCRASEPRRQQDIPLPSVIRTHFHCPIECIRDSRG